MIYNASKVFGGLIMDTFVEQIVAIKKTVKTWILYFVIAVFAIVLMTLVFYLPYTRAPYSASSALRSLTSQWHCGTDTASASLLIQ